MMKKTFLFLLLMLWSVMSLQAKEGMYLPNLLQKVYGDMRTEGLRLTPEQIYALNHSSLTDAIVHFGGGCTAEVISDKGLILTNHHCGYHHIQSHSSVENDYLGNGFWARTMGDELKNPGLTASFLEEVADVTDRVLEGVEENLSEKERQQKVGKNIDAITQEELEERGEHITIDIKPFNYGDAFYMFVSKVYKDVRLVGAPPSAIGKFGGDTDNWMWPRHTGDFSLFRIYANDDNEPAEPSDGNVPYHPGHHLPVSLEGVDQGDFALIYGFPGSTQHYLPSDVIEFIMNEKDPARIAMREASLSVIDAAMQKSDTLRLQYAGKQSSISNYYKKWQGEIKGLRKIGALEQKRRFEQEFREKVASQPEWKERYGNLLKELKEVQHKREPYDLARALFIEYMYYGPDLIRYVRGFEDLATEHASLKEEEKLQKALEKQKERAQRHFGGHTKWVDRRLFKELTARYREEMPSELLPDVFAQVIDPKFDGNVAAYTDHLYEKSRLVDHSGVKTLLSKLEKSPKALEKDPAYQFVKSLYSGYFKKVAPKHASTGRSLDSLMRDYVEARQELFPEGQHWYDANSTLRISYGKVEGSRPRDGMSYRYYTTLDGVMAKHDTTDRLFTVPEKLRELHRQKDYGQYGDHGELFVCFTSSLHTSGGNSGSPVINGEGHLVGLNFDRSWESVMSDLVYDPDRCRNISVDIRYVLFLIDKFAGMDRLIEEMDLVDASYRLTRVEEVLKDHPDSVTLYLQQSRYALKAGEVDKARESAGKAIGLAPDDPETHQALVAVWLREEAYEKALEYLEEKVLEDELWSASSSLLQGKALLGNGVPEEAVKAFSRAVACRSDGYEPYLWRARAYRELGEEKKACNDLKMVRTLGGDRYIDAPGACDL